MLDKISLDDTIWASIDAMDTSKLLETFLNDPDTSASVFHQLLDCFWDSGTLKPAFFIAAPYLIELSVKSSFQKAKDIWCYLGCYSSAQEEFRSSIPSTVLQKFDVALEFAALVYPNILIKNKHELTTDLGYLIPAQFSFIKHAFGKIALSNYFLDDSCGESLIYCDSNHENDLLIYRCGITHIGQKKVATALPLDINIDVAETEENEPRNTWQAFIQPLEFLLKDNSISKEIVSHIDLSVSLIKNRCISTELPMRFAFSLCGSLLLWAGDENLAMRAFHAWDYVTCAVCKEKFRFADNWQS